MSPYVQSYNDVANGMFDFAPKPEFANLKLNVDNESFKPNPKVFRPQSLWDMLTQPPRVEDLRAPEPKPESKPKPTTAARSQNLEAAQQMSTLGSMNRRSESDEIISNARALSTIDRENRYYNSARDIDFTKRNLTEISPMVSGILSDRQRTSLANEFPYKMYDTQSQLMDNAFRTQSQSNAGKLGALLQSSRGRYQ
jgi:hypothetical protein